MVFMGLQQVLGSEEARMVVSYVGGTILILMGLKLIFDAFGMKIEGVPSINNVVAHRRTPLHRLIF